MHPDNTMSPDVELAESPSHNNVRQRKGRSMHAPTANTRPFAGRIGGNQEFTLTPDDSSFITITEKAPDAAAGFSWRQSLSIAGFSDIELWKQATIEGVGTCVQIYIAGLYAIGLIPATTATSLGPIVPAAIGSFMNFILIALFIYSAGPVSGGHFNPFITISTFFARLSSLPRTVLYVLFQCTGSVIAGFLVRASLGVSPEEFRAVPGCYVDTSLVTPGEAYALETMTAFALIFLAFGVGLDPRQQQVFGPAYSPVLVGVALGMCTFASGIVRPGYAGASLNPARCLGLMAPAERFDYHYIHWLGDLTAAMLNGLLYCAIPIYKD